MVNNGKESQAMLAVLIDAENAKPSITDALMAEIANRKKMDASTLIWGVIFGSIGLGFFVYGKKQKTVVPFLSGIGLMEFPYFVSNPYALFFLGVVLTALPYRWEQL